MAACQFLWNIKSPYRRLRQEGRDKGRMTYETLVLTVPKDCQFATLASYGTGVSQSAAPSTAKISLLSCYGRFARMLY